MSEIKPVIKLKSSKPKAIAILLKVEPLPLKIEPLDKFFKKFEVDSGNMSNFDKNQHTARLSDTRIAYDFDLKRQNLLSKETQLLLIFLCIRLVNYIKTMNLACAYLEDIPSTGDS
ncbi:MAG: hypothetical protein EON51_13470 [Acinetobacter sp.]|nr:MAG: hypothetical protein EON51_13470 [Acinetobacter sp.]